MAGALAGTVSLFTICNLHYAVPAPILTFFGLIGLDCFCLQYFIFGSAAQVVVKSRKVSKLWKKQRIGNTEKEWTVNKSFARSCAPITIKCGWLNYISVLTPLRCMNFILMTTMKLSFFWQR